MQCKCNYASEEECLTLDKDSLVLWRYDVNTQSHQVNEEDWYHKNVYGFNLSKEYALSNIYAENMLRGVRPN